MIPLHVLHTDIDARVRQVREAHPDWPCAKGCDACCRQLARLPQLTASEWALLRPALAVLPVDQLEAIRQKMQAASKQDAGPVVCPLLDEASGACPIYAQRPIACRTYGFYVERGVGLYCADIKNSVDRDELADVVWGNQEAIARALVEAGETRALDAWFSERPTIGLP